MKRIKVFLSLILALTMLVTACSNNDTDNEGGATSDNKDTQTAEAVDNNDGGDTKTGDDITTINIRVMNPVVNIDKVLDKFYEDTKDDPVLSKIKVNLTFVPGADYKDKLTLAITAQEDYDLMFVGSWHGLNDKINDGLFKDLSSYFNNDAYPGLKTAFSDDFIRANEFNGATYAIPIAESFEDVKGVIYREDLRVKYGLPEIKDYDTFMTYLEGVAPHIADEGLTSAYGADSGMGLREFMSTVYDNRRNNIFLFNSGNEGANFYVGLNEDGTKVLDAAIAGDEASHFAGFGGGYDYDFISERFENLLPWIEYVNEDSVVNDGTTNYPAAHYGTATEWMRRTKENKTEHPDDVLGFFVLDDKQRNLEPGAIVSNLQAWNFLCVPTWSEKTDAVMAFLDWMWGSQENHDLVQYGIEGEDWEAIGDNAYKTLDAESYTMPGYSFTWNPTYIRYDEEVVNNPKALEVYDYMFDLSTYVLSPLAGFNFNNADVESSVATISAYTNDYKFNWGVYGDETAAMIEEYHSACLDAGLEDIRAEFVKQLQEFLDSKN